MPVNTEHPLYKKYAPVWEKCRAFTEGSDAVKDAGVKYLPMLEGQTATKYANYKQRAFFYNSVGRTVAALVGGAMRKLPAVKVPKRIEYILKDCTGTGVSLDEFIITLMSEQLQTARTGLLVDRPAEGGNPYIALYPAESIINWGKGFYVVEEETLVPSADDRFELEEVEIYRELFIDSEGNYAINLFEEVEEEYQFVGKVTPTSAGRPMQYLPFFIVSPSGLDDNPDKPPIKDLVDILATWYMVAADLAWANHVVSCPTPWIASDMEKTENTVLALGMDTAWILPAGSEVGFMEFTGQGLKSLEDTLSRLETQMAALGARLLDTRNKTVIETATSSLSKEAAATSVMSQLILSVEQGLTRVLRTIAEWEGANPDEVEVHLNRELISSAVDANMLNAMVAAIQAGRLSQETLYHNLVESGLTEPGVSVEDEIKRIKAALPKEVTPLSDTQDNQGLDNTENV